ncbi:MAG: sigma-70 family RNA polymerase sigma factor, partial [Bacteroidota bacterium]|nr:sigma-70 family RNA polymerase sigma factor [Bacteroidota bacterium]
MHNLAENIEVNSDFSLIEKICLGEIALFEVLIRRYNPVLYKIARSYGFNHQDAEDLMQETHVAAYLALSKFEGRSSYKTWVSRIMVNKCLYKLKYGSCKNEVSSEPSSFTLQSMDKKAQTNPTEQTLLNREFAVILEQSLQRLPVQYRTVFV